MKLIFQSFLYCCLLATVAHCVEFDVKPQLRKRWVGVILKMLQTIRDATDRDNNDWSALFALSSWLLFLFQAQYLVKEQTEARSWPSVRREDGSVAALCQSGGSQGHIAATFQVRLQIPRNLWILWVIFACGTTTMQSGNTQKWHLRSEWKSYCLSVSPPVLEPMSAPGGLKPQATSREDRVVRWAPAQCTTWHTGCTSSATNTRSGMPPWRRSAHRDTDGGADPSPSGGSRWGWSRAGWGPCGAQQPHPFTSWRLSWDGPEQDLEEIGTKAGEWHRVKFSTCVWLPPSTVQNIFLDARTESEPD